MKWKGSNMMESTMDRDGMGMEEVRNETELLMEVVVVRRWNSSPLVIASSGAGCAGAFHGCLLVIRATRPVAD